MALTNNPPPPRVGGRHRRPDRQRVVFGPDGPRSVDPSARLDAWMSAVGYLLIFVCGVLFALALVMSA